jgi:hypothetical protein
LEKIQAVSLHRESPSVSMEGLPTQGNVTIVTGLPKVIERDFVAIWIRAQGRFERRR